MSTSVVRAWSSSTIVWKSLALASLPAVYFGLLHRAYSTSAVYGKSKVFRSPRHPPAYDAEKVLRGARDVDTPYGNMRVYEFGDAQATRKVLFLPGISTPCISLAAIAHTLAAEGCRVMLMDLFGRGFSDGPDPEQVRYDGRLYASQILCAISSSDISWTGADTGFTLVGFSLGGGLVADFASYFPALVDDLVLIAPGGLQRKHNISLRSKILYSRGWLPESLLRWLVKRRMGAPASAAPPQQRQHQPAGQDGDIDPAKLSGPDPEADLRAESSSNSTKPSLPRAAPSPTSADGAAACDWQVQHHPGFVPAFMSSLRYAPIQEQQHRWALIGRRLNAQREARRALKSPRGYTDLAPGDSQKAGDRNEELHRKCGFRSGTVLLLVGADDDIVLADEIVPDARAALGHDNVTVACIEGAGHELPITHADACARRMLAVWSGT